MHYRKIIISLLAFFVLAWSVIAQDTVLTVTWVDSEACAKFDILTDDYSSAEIIVSCVPETQWFDTIFFDFAIRAGSDIVIMDTQFLGAATDGNHLVALDEWYAETFADDTYTSEILESHRTDNRLVAMPLTPDVRLIVYRDDIYQQLGLVAPTTWEELVAQAQIFATSEEIPFGFATHWSRQSDNIATTWNHILWSYGGVLWDAETLSVDGIVNSENALIALNIAVALRQTAPDEVLTFTPNDVVESICNDESAIVEIWSSGAHQIIDEEQCEQSESIRFSLVPAGDDSQVTSYGGDAMSISNYSTEQDAVRDFMTWFYSDTIQRQWLIDGGTTANLNVLSDAEIQITLPFIDTYLQSLPLARDYYQIDAVPILLDLQQQYLQFAISGQLAPQDALDALAIAQQDVLDTRYGTPDD